MAEDTTPKTRVLIAEDDTSARRGLMELVRSWGFAAEGAADGEEALERITSFRPSIVLADLAMPRRDGLGLLRALEGDLDDLTFVMITGQGSIDTAVAAMKEGAFDYLTKPVDPRRLRLLLDKVVERQDTLREVRTLRQQLHSVGQFGRIIGNSPAIRAIYRIIEQAAPTEASILICGESGTGKELTARTIHQLSRRAAQPFVGLNCAAIPEALLESEMFGHERGAFTGAVERRTGCFELAHRGTLFLDEVADMAPGIQAKLLRALQERTVRRLGGQREQAIDVRILAATNADPGLAIDAGRLREDLFYRLNVVMLELPPLRDRRDDIALLVQSFLEEFNTRNRKQVTAVDAAAMQRVEAYGWPGNIRQLRNVIERAVILSRGNFIEPAHLPPELHEQAPPAGQADALTPGMRVDDAERRLIELTLEHTGNNKTRAAAILGISVKTLHNKLNRFKQMNAGGEGAGA
tara:strand:+ start:1716 stop:3113 length:1398 start_codon:yes stop_codon:yes gene_type:complete